MHNLKRFTAMVALATWALVPANWAATNLNFPEVFELLRTNLTGADAAGLNHAAALGLIQQLQPQVSLVESGAMTNGSGSGPAPLLAKAEVFEGKFAYFRAGRVTAGLEKEFGAAFGPMSRTNKLRGVVLDLRFAGGHDYPAAFALADRFFVSEQPLIDWGEGVKRSTSKDEVIRLPVMVLVNARTAAAAEALAGMLRQANPALLLGSPTAGQASKFKEFTLQSGQRLRIATAPVKVGQGEALPLTGLKPDIEVQASLEDEQAWIEDAYKVKPKPGSVARASSTSTNEPSLSGTNRAGRRLKEADLVRMHREGLDPDWDLPGSARRAGEVSPPALQDAALVRALDLLKGLAAVQPFRSP